MEEWLELLEMEVYRDGFPDEGVVTDLPSSDSEGLIVVVVGMGGVSKNLTPGRISGMLSSKQSCVE